MCNDISYFLRLHSVFIHGINAFFSPIQTNNFFVRPFFLTSRFIYLFFALCAFSVGVGVVAVCLLTCLLMV